MSIQAKYQAVLNLGEELGAKEGAVAEANGEARVVGAVGDFDPGDGAVVPGPLREAGQALRGSTARAQPGARGRERRSRYEVSSAFAQGSVRVCVEDVRGGARAISVRDQSRRGDRRRADRHAGRRAGTGEEVVPVLELKQSTRR